MNIKSDQNKTEAETETDSFLSSWERRKQNVLLEKEALDNQRLGEKGEEAKVELTDDDMPAIESLTDESDYSVFLSPKVSESLRKLALRKLFHTADFNICDGLDDYDEDFTSFAKLGNIITADLRHRMEVDARKKLEASLDEEKLETIATSSEVDLASENEELPADEKQVELNDRAEEVEEGNQLEASQRQQGLNKNEKGNG